MNAGAASDAELATAVASGDREALGAIFDRYAPRLLAFSQSMLHRRADAEDALQDIFILTATRIGGLREPDRLRSWLFSIARHECLRRLERRNREVLVDEIPDRATSAQDRPADAALDRELAALLADAIAGLADRDRLVLDLADRQGLSTDEVGAALAMSPASAYKLLTRARATARKSIGALLVARTGRRNCPDLDALLGNWNGALTPLLRKRVARHIEDCTRCQEQERRVASPAALLGSGTAFALPIPFGLRSHVLDTAYDAQTRAIVAPPTQTWPQGWPPKSPGLRTSSPPGGNGSHGPAVAIAAAVAIILAVGAFLVLRPHPVTPEAVRGGPPPVASSGAVTSPPAAAGLIPSGTTSGSAISAIATPASVQSSSAATSSDNTTPTMPTTSATTRATSTPRTTATTTSTTRTTRSTATSSATSTRPVITDMSVRCEYPASGPGTPYLTWDTSQAKGIRLSIDNPGVVGSYGDYGPSGDLELPPNGCDPSQGTQVYTVYAVGNDGTMTQRTINWDPPTPPTTTSSSPVPETSETTRTSETTTTSSSETTTQPVR